jgi:hypothetical protein
LGERRVRNAEVEGSIPFFSTTYTDEAGPKGPASVLFRRHHVGLRGGQRVMRVATADKFWHGAAPLVG